MAEAGRAGQRHSPNGDLDLIGLARLDSRHQARQVSALEAVRTPARQDFFARDEEMLVSLGVELCHHHFVRALAYWEQRVDPDGTEDAAAADHAARARAGDEACASDLARTPAQRRADAFVHGPMVG